MGSEAKQPHLTTRQSPSILLIVTHGFCHPDSVHSPLGISFELAEVVIVWM
ncbi:hypothetical protein [Allocoleopsis franciscana]|uniref:hypothetical protein n=1 Tax=Allocoleopsis franciscana TaxID=2886352 RepID=UPI0002EF3EFD|nr:hypothetical protein [Allocoleopsis franciscana]